MGAIDDANDAANAATGAEAAKDDPDSAKCPHCGQGAGNADPSSPMGQFFKGMRKAFGKSDE